MFDCKRETVEIVSNSAGYFEGLGPLYPEKPPSQPS